MKPRYAVLMCLVCAGVLAKPELLRGETIRALVAGHIAATLSNPGGVSIPLSYSSSAVIRLDQDVRFLRGVEMELTAPETYLDHYGSLAIALYAHLDTVPAPGAADIEARQISFEPIPNKIQTVYQIPIRNAHGLRTTPYSVVPTGVIEPSAFPLLFRIMPVIKGMREEIERMVFQLRIKPVLSSEGAVRIIHRYPELLPNKPFVVLIDDAVVENTREEQILREGEHHLAVLSEDYRNESRRFMVERGKVLDITVDLQDPTPVLTFEAPDSALIYVDNQLLTNTMKPYPVEPGRHEVKFQMSDYSIIRPLTARKGKSYHVALTVDLTISESE